MSTISDSSERYSSCGLLSLQSIIDENDCRIHAGWWIAAEFNGGTTTDAASQKTMIIETVLPSDADVLPRCASARQLLRSVKALRTVNVYASINASP